MFKNALLIVLSIVSFWNFWHRNDFQEEIKKMKVENDRMLSAYEGGVLGLCNLADKQQNETKQNFDNHFKFILEIYDMVKSDRESLKKYTDDVDRWCTEITEWIKAVENSRM